MKGKILISLAILLSTAGLSAENPERKTILTGGHEREYLLYTPENRNTVKPDGIIVALHGFNGSNEDFFDKYSIKEISDSLNYIIIAPQALPEQDESVYEDAAKIKQWTGQEIALDAVWACGLRVNVKILGVNLFDNELNKNIDDIGFIAEIIRQSLVANDMPTENIFFVGTSMGAYMTYQYALMQPVKSSGIVAIAGSMGLNIRGKENRMKVPVCDFHSQTDEVVPYTGSYDESLAVISLAENKAAVINYWTEVNETASPTVDYYPSTNDITVEKITYPHPENEVIHYRMNGASHSYFFRKDNGDCMDYVEEIGKFIAAHSVTHSDGIKDINTMYAMAVWPNPVSDILHLSLTDGYASVYDLSGRLVLSAEIRSGQINVASLKKGVYILRVQAGNDTFTAKLIKK